MRSSEAAPQPQVLPSSEILEAELSNNSSDISMDEFEAEYSTDTPDNSSDTQPAATPDLYTSSATMLRSSTERVAAFLEKLSAGKDARQEARAEKMEAAKETVKKVGRGALKGAKNTGLFTLGMSVLTVELAVDGGTQARNKVMEIAMNARKRFAERAAYREQDRRTAEEQYNNDHTEAVEMNEQKKADQEAAYDSYSDNIATTERRENQEAAFDSYDSNIKYSEALERKRMALARKEARKARRQEIYGNVRDKSGELYGRAKAGAKRFGRAALKMLKRTASAGRAAASAAVGAGKEAWAQSA